MHWPGRLRRVYAPLFSHSMFFSSSNFRLYLLFWQISGPRSPSPPASSLPPLGLERLEVSSQSSFQFAGKAPHHTYGYMDTRHIYLLQWPSSPNHSIAQLTQPCQNGIKMAISGNKAEMLLYMEWLVTIKRPFLLSDESDGFSRSSCSGCSANPVNIVL